MWVGWWKVPAFQFAFRKYNMQLDDSEWRLLFEILDRWGSFQIDPTDKPLYDSIISWYPRDFGWYFKPIFRNIFPWFLPRRTSEPYRYWTSNFRDKKRHHFSHSDCAWTEEFDFLYFGTPWNLHPKEPSFRVRLCKPFGLHFQEPFLGYISSLLQTSG